MAEKKITPKGRVIVAIESVGRKLRAAPFIIVDNQKANIIGRNSLPHIGIKISTRKTKTRGRT